MKNIQGKIILVVVMLLVAFGFSDIDAQSFPTDSENLRERLLQLGFPDFLRAYQERVRIFDTWDKIKESGAPLFPVAIGIIDSGIDARDGKHPEFVNVNLEGSRPFALQDRAEYFYGSDYASGHGTKVAGIIGANNLSSTSSINYRFPQMNGILSGVTDNYNLISETGRVVDFTPQGLGIIADRMPENAIVNISYISKEIKDEDFNDFTGYWRDVFNSNSDKTFIIAAGNDNQNVITLTPQNISVTNTIIVGATDLNDGRLIVSSTKASNFGLGVDISATGESIYVPAIRGKGDFPSLGSNYSKSSAGTSLSAPMITGVAGLIKAIKPELTPAQIKQILVETGDPISTDKPIGPRLNAYKAVCHPLVLNCTPAPSILTVSDIIPSSVSLSWTKNTDPDFAYYHVFRITSLVPPAWIPIAQISDRNQTSFTDTLPQGTTYYYQIRTYNQIGQFSRSNTLGALYVPYANITVNGDISDWSGQTPSIQDYINDKQPGSPSGADISNVYLAHDDQYFYARMDLADGPPNTQDIVYYSLSFDSQQAGHSIGDKYLRSQFFPGPEQNQSILKQRTSIDPHQAVTIAVEPAASGQNTLEMQTTLYKLNGGLLYFFVRASTDLSALTYYDGTIQIVLKLPGI